MIKLRPCQASFDEGVSTIPDECMGVGADISTAAVLGNESAENRSGRPISTMQKHNWKI